MVRKDRLEVRLQLCEDKQQLTTPISVSVQQQEIQVHNSSIWVKHSTKNISQDNENSNHTVKERRNSSILLLGRHFNNRKLMSRMPEKYRSNKESIGKSRLCDSNEKVSSISSARNRFLRCNYQYKTGNNVSSERKGQHSTKDHQESNRKTIAREKNQNSKVPINHRKIDVFKYNREKFKTLSNSTTTSHLKHGRKEIVEWRNAYSTKRSSRSENNLKSSRGLTRNDFRSGNSSKYCNNGLIDDRLWWNLPKPNDAREMEPSGSGMAHQFEGTFSSGTNVLSSQKEQSLSKKHTIPHSYRQSSHHVLPEEWKRESRLLSNGGKKNLANVSTKSLANKESYLPPIKRKCDSRQTIKTGRMGNNRLNIPTTSTEVRPLFSRPICKQNKSQNKQIRRKKSLSGCFFEQMGTGKQLFGSSIRINPSNNNTSTKKQSKSTTNSSKMGKRSMVANTVNNNSRDVLLNQRGHDLQSRHGSIKKLRMELCSAKSSSNQLLTLFKARDVILKYQLADSTIRTYANHVNKFKTFCFWYYIEDYWTLNTISLYLTNMLLKGSGGSIKQATAALQHECKCLGIEIDWKSTIISDIKSSSTKIWSLFDRQKLKREPFDLNNLKYWLENPPSNMNPWSYKLYAAVIAIGVRALMRPGELADLKYSDVTFESNGHLVISLGQTKTDQQGKGSKIHIEPSNHSICPVKIFKDYYNYCKYFKDNPASPLFSSFESNAFFNTTDISNIVKQVSVYNPNNKSTVSGHSLRKAGATYLAKAGYTAPQLQVAGRWKSEVFLTYVSEEILPTLGTSNTLFS